MNKKEVKETSTMTTEERVKLSLMKRKKRAFVKKIVTLIVWLIIIAVIAFTVITYQQSGSWWWTPKDTQDTSSKVAKEVTVEELTITQTIDLSGVVEPYDIQRVVFRSTGAVTEIFVEEGDSVKKRGPFSHH